MIPRRRREAEYKPWRREEEARQVAKALKNSKEELPRVIDARAAKRLEELFADAERRARDLPDDQGAHDRTASTGTLPGRQHRCAGAI